MRLTPPFEVGYKPVTIPLEPDSHPPIKTQTCYRCQLRLPAALFEFQRGRRFCKICEAELARYAAEVRAKPRKKIPVNGSPRCISRCIYCNAEATTTDHVIPWAYATNRRRGRRNSQNRDLQVD